MGRYRRIINTVCIVLCLLLLTQTMVLAQSDGEDVSPYTGLDIIFIVDQSGSMGGAAFNPRNDSRIPDVAMDPDGLRFQAVQAMVTWLGGFSEEIFIFS